MSQGNGAFGATNAASGTSRPQCCCSPMRSLPSAPRPCSRITRRRGLPPATGGRDGPDRAISIAGLAFCGTVHWVRGIADPPCRCHAAMMGAWTAADIEILIVDELSGGSIVTVRLSTPAGELVMTAEIESYRRELVLAGLHIQTET